MTALDPLQIVIIGMSTGFGSSLGIELAKALIHYLKGLKIVKKHQYQKGGETVA